MDNADQEAVKLSARLQQAEEGRDNAAADAINHYAKILELETSLRAQSMNIDSFRAMAQEARRERDEAREDLNRLLSEKYNKGFQAGVKSTETAAEGLYAEVKAIEADVSHPRYRRITEALSEYNKLMEKKP